MLAALASFERSLLTPNARFDRYLRGELHALTAPEQHGYRLFKSYGCVACHQEMNIGGNMYQKFGMVEDYWKVTGSDPIDKGRADVTKDPADLYVFRVASLRNVAMTPPYFHDGSVATLPDAVKVMARVQLGVALSDNDTRDIGAFLEALTGELPASFATALMARGRDATPILIDLRLIKTPYERKMLDRSLDISSEAQMAARRLMGAACAERERLATQSRTSFSCCRT